VQNTNPLKPKKWPWAPFQFLSRQKSLTTCPRPFMTSTSPLAPPDGLANTGKIFCTPSTAATQINALDDQTRSALVMGTEDSGLETKDLELCQHFITIPTHRDYPSMNLSHSLSILVYEIAMASEAGKRFHDPIPQKLAPGKEVEHMFGHMRRTLQDIDFLDHQNPDHILRTFRRLFGSAGLTPRDIKIIRGLMSRIDWTEGQRRKYSPPGE
jgi:tRNA/rRNA methyltransferase